MVWAPLIQRLDRLPLILAGPILRRTESAGVTVWVALRQPCEVTLSVYATADGGEKIEALRLSGTRSTVALGQFLHSVAVTATALDSDRLRPGQIYAYDLQFNLQPSPAQNSDWGDRWSDRQSTLQQALTSPCFPRSEISYFGHRLPTFALPPSDLNHLQLVHGSCRKPHGSGQDALSILDALIEQRAGSAEHRPHQLFLTGDQIYGDDVADPLLWLLTEGGNALLGWVEQLPIADPGKPDLEPALALEPQQLQPGQRSQVAEVYGGFTAGLRNQPERSKSHLFGLGEFYATYLFSWSPVLWPDPIPAGSPLCGEAKSGSRWSKEVNLLREFVRTLERVRRALANVATYMIFDDHDISDDWYLNQDWCLRVLGKPLGRRTVQNGLLAYALFQAWGNTPEQFEGGQPGELLLAAAEAWSASAGQDLAAAETIAQRLGLPPIDPFSGLPKLRLDQQVWVLDRHPQSLRWHYTVRGSCHEVLVLDTRTWRGYPAGQAKPTAPAMLLSPTAFEQQLRQPLREPERGLAAGGAIEASLVIAPTNLINLEAIDWVQFHDLKRGRVFHNDVGDAWNMHKPAFARLLATLFEQRDRVIVLSGDIHFGFVARLHYWAGGRHQETPHLLVQLTASPCKNSEWKTLLIHTKLKSLFPERAQDWLGWNSDPGSEPAACGPAVIWPVQRRLKFIYRLRQSAGPPQPIATPPPRPPDWRYQIDWINRQPAHRGPRSPRQPQPGWLGRLTQPIARLWRNRWLQEGREVVGHNHIAVVGFKGASPQADPAAVVQDLYWLPPWSSDYAVFSRFYAPLQLKAPPLLPSRIVSQLGLAKPDESGGEDRS